MLITDRLRAAIFDLDGTVVDNMSLHAEAFAVFAERHGLAALTSADRAKLDGRRNSEIFPVLFGREMPREEWLAYEHEKEGLYRELSRGRLHPRGRPAGSARAARHRRRGGGAGHVGARAERRPYPERSRASPARFPPWCVAIRWPNGKPAPDVFLEASRQLDVAPVGCVVFEDAPMGITAARAAGMRVVAITSSFSAAHLAALADPPDLACGDFDAFLAMASW